MPVHGVITCRLVSIPHWGDIFSHYGYRTAHTGKWHLDGAGYFGDGVCPDSLKAILV